MPTPKPVHRIPINTKILPTGSMVNIQEREDLIGIPQIQLAYAILKNRVMRQTKEHQDG